MEILYIDDEIHNLNTFKTAFRHLYTIYTAKNAFEGLDILKDNEIKVVISDQRMDGMSGIEFLKKIKRLYPDCIRIILTGYSDVDVILRAINDCGIYRFILKPWESAEMQQTLRTGFELYEIRKTNRDLIQKLSEANKLLSAENNYLKKEMSNSQEFIDIDTNDKTYKALLDKIKKVAETNTTCLVQGETGTGKELIVNAIYKFSPLAQKSFIKVNCAALSENLVGSELFGHVKGAFTGAINDRIGRFELADGGTIFLDEIGEISLNVQKKLLRIIQEGEYQRIGSNQTRKVNIRILAATNRNLEERIKEGKFREDLYYRLNIVPIHTIPLRNRKDDIPLLCQRFIEKYSIKLGIKNCTITDAGIDKLKTYNWPGNVRELENIIQRFMILENGGNLSFKNWFPVNYTFPSNQEFSLEENEINHIKGALLKTNGRVFGPKGAAEILQINPKTLMSRMKKLGIQRK
jgi:DNA-binding NtrC family response regulator